MAFKRYQPEKSLSKDEKVSLMAEHMLYCERLYKNDISALDVKIPREVFATTLDKIGTLLKNEAKSLSTTVNDLSIFLKDNPLPPHLEAHLTDEFRAFCLLLNGLKQWVSAESAATDRYLLGGKAREICREAVCKCIITGEELGDGAELHHPLRDGRPPILISKEGHILISQNSQNDDNDVDWQTIKELRRKSNMSWKQLREGCNAISTHEQCRPSAKTFANKCIKATSKTPREIVELLNSRGL